MTQDLSLAAKPVSNLFQADLAKNSASFSISDAQLRFFKTQGYLPDIKVLSDFQADKLLEELADLSNPQSPGNELFHEYHSNESTDPNKILFHAFGAWRIKPSFHDILWAPGFLIPASQLLGGVLFASGMISFSVSPPDTGVLLRGIRIIPIGQEHSLCSISPGGSHSMMPTKKMAAFIIFPKAMSGIYYQSLGLQATWNLLNPF